MGVAAMTLHKKPKQRAIDAVLQLDGQTLRGTFYINDFGGDSHRLEGVFSDDSGVECRLHGELSGVQFVPVRKGRPKGDGALLDVGLVLCHRWHQRKGDKPKNRADASLEALNWWHAKGWPGASDEQALNKRIRGGSKALKGMSTLRFIPDDPSDVVTLCALPPSAFTFEAVVDSIHATVDGRGWLWRSDRARAVLVRIRCKYSTGQATPAAIALLRACQGR